MTIAPAAALLPKSRRAVLGLLYGQPDRDFYLREVADLAELAVGQVQRELNRLADAGLLSRRRRGRHVYFQANPRCPIFDELRGMVRKTIGAAAVLAEAMRPLGPNIASAFIYGSIARGQERAESDVDLMVIGDVTFAQIVDAIRPAEAILHRAINPTVYPVDEFRAKLAAGHPFLDSVMHGEKLFVVGDADELAGLSEQRVDS